MQLRRSQVPDVDMSGGGYPEVFEVFVLLRFGTEGKESTERKEGIFLFYLTFRTLLTFLTFRSPLRYFLPVPRILHHKSPLKNFVSEFIGE